MAHEDCARCASFCAESEITRRVRMKNANTEDKSCEMALVCNTPGALVPQGPSHMERDEDQEPLTIESSTARFSQRVIETEITHTDERGEDQPTSSKSERQFRNTIERSEKCMSRCNDSRVNSDRWKITVGTRVQN